MIRATGIAKSFGATRALSGVDLEVRAGEVHALVGENGAGKSTLMAILSGALAPDAGTLALDGAPWAPRSPGEARRAGVALVHQELSLCPHLTVEENVVLGDEPVRGAGLLVDRRAMRERAVQALAQVGADVDPTALVAGLSVATRQLVEIARAVALPRRRVVLLDEPTSSLAAPEVERLFELIARLRDEAKLAIVYISHFLEEVRRVADRWTVLRDGKTVGSGAIAEVTSDDLVALMVADHRQPRVDGPRAAAGGGEAVLELRDLTGKSGKPRGASLVLRRGEVLGLAGLVGAGRTELLRCVYGLDAVARGAVKVKAFGFERGATPGRRIAEGVGMLSEDRKGEGLALGLSLVDNVVLPRMRRWMGRADDDRARALLERLRVRYGAVSDRVASLSGGNQQKVALARLLHQGADVLLLDEPTRGIDVTAKANVHALVRDLAREGKAVLLVSSSLPELLAVCDRVAVVHKGAVGDPRPASEWTEHTLLAAAAGAET